MVAEDVSQWKLAEHTGPINGLNTRWLDFDRSGNDERTILMIHGLNTQAYCWQPVVERMTSGTRVICPDLRGHGATDWSREGYWMADFADDMAALVDRLGLDRFDVIGHSLGVRIALILAGRLGDRVRTLALSDCGPEAPRAGAENVRNRAVGQNSTRAPAEEDEARERLRETYPSWQPEFIDDQVSHIYRRNWAGKLVRRADPELSWISGRAGLREVDLMWQMSRAITAPTLIMRGRTSFLLDEAGAARMGREIPDARLLEFDTGHYIPFEDPDGFTRAYCEFLAEHPDR